MFQTTFKGIENRQFNNCNQSTYEYGIDGLCGLLVVVFVHEVVDPQVSVVQYSDLSRQRPTCRHQVLLDVVAVMVQLLGQQLVSGPLRNHVGECSALQGHEVDEPLVGPDVVLIQHSSGEVLSYTRFLQHMYCLQTKTKSHW